MSESLAQALRDFADILEAVPKTEDKMIRVWRFYEAPEELQNLSRNGGDEDWLALVPASMERGYIPWLQQGPFGVCDVAEYSLPDGSVVYIGCHS